MQIMAGSNRKIDIDGLIVYPMNNLNLSGYGITKCGKIWAYPKNHNGNRTGRWIKYVMTTDKYYRTSLINDEKQRKSYLVHRLVATMFIQNIKNKPEIDHINCNKIDNRVENLEWVTRKENHYRSVKNGLQKNSINTLRKNVQSTMLLSLDDADNIRNIYKEIKIKQIELAKLYNVNEQLINRIIKNKSYKRGGFLE